MTKKSEDSVLKAAQDAELAQVLTSIASDNIEWFVESCLVDGASTLKALREMGYDIIKM